jgi:hypothetical protein
MEPLLPDHAIALDPLVESLSGLVKRERCGLPAALKTIGRLTMVFRR